MSTTYSVVKDGLEHATAHIGLSQASRVANLVIQRSAAPACVRIVAIHFNPVTFETRSEVVKELTKGIE
ncbi:hypothetical protein [Ralstonia phage phiITL-1]|uniref:Uncharacterized protein n=1 Tax=Ralstonia phage phiITL-1 TaxID=1597967 RepID=A0A0U1ZAG5_9CAUD|nr:hypothetical protein HOR02_gp27 [Ralstonia phage phiITL-1]AJT60811.1 hypothetical protein [Ralstonia phage phiITL-1]